eukprot:2821366-Rhodomonas_salina.1
MQSRYESSVGAAIALSWAKLYGLNTTVEEPSERTRLSVPLHQKAESWIFSPALALSTAAGLSPHAQ